MGTSMLRDDAAVPAGDVSVAVLAWRFQGAVRVTAVAKATFVFAPDAEMPRVAAEPIVHAEVHHGNSPTQSIRLTTDLVPYLAHADVLLTGSACAPRGTFVETLPVRLGLFDGARPVLDKTVLVRKPGGIKQVPLVYEGAYGGIGWPENPFGKGAIPGSGEPLLVDPFEEKKLAGFGPIGQAWPARKRLLGALPRRALDAEGVIDIPERFDWAYFQAAPADQRVPFLRGDEWIVMDGMHRKIPRLRVRLPSARGLGLVYGLGPWGVAEGQPIALHADMLRIEAAEGCCTVSFRGTFPVADESALDAVRVVLGVELPGQPIAWPDPALLVARAADGASPPSGDILLSEEDFESVDGEVLAGTMTGVEFEPDRGAEPPAPLPRREPEAPWRDPALETLKSTVYSESDPLGPPDPSGPMRRSVLPFQGTADGPSALRQSPARRAWAQDHRFSGTMVQTPEEIARAAQRSALPFGEREPSVPPPAPPSTPLPASSQAIPEPEPEKRVAASPWAPAPAPVPPAPKPLTPPPPQGPPAASPTLKKGLYGRFGGKR